jgi:hypothetical protein
MPLTNIIKLNKWRDAYYKITRKMRAIAGLFVGLLNCFIAELLFPLANPESFRENGN